MVYAYKCMLAQLYISNTNSNMSICHTQYSSQQDKSPDKEGVEGFAQPPTARFALRRRASSHLTTRPISFYQERSELLVVCIIDHFGEGLEDVSASCRSAFGHTCTGIMWLRTINT